MTTSTWPFPTVEPESVGLSSSRLALAADLLDKFVADGNLAGGVVAVARNNKLAHLSTHGWQSIERGIPMAEDSIFRVYSMTKPMTSACILQLFESGQLGLEQKVREILPCFDRVRIKNTDGDLVAPDRAPTIYDLLRHMAGLGYGRARLENEAEPSNLAEFVEALCDEPLVEQPGKRWIYSLATDVLGRVVEVVSGMPFDEYLHKHLFGPLEMTDTDFHVSADKAGRLTSLYGDGDDTIEATDDAGPDSPYRSRPKVPSGGGGLASTTCDMMRFCSALLNEGTLGDTRILGRKTVELMCTDHLPPEHPAIRFTGKDLRFGLGVSVICDLGESRCIGSVGEFGWGGAAGTMEWIDPAEDMVALLMIQHRGTRHKALEHRFKAALYGALI